MLEFEKTNLWKRTLGDQGPTDPDSQARGKLRHAYFGMRENARLLVTTIPQDCPGLTDHSIDHLDALWEMADLILGDEFELTPAEAFVLGGAILLHDSAMSVSSFPNGITELQSRPEWKDSATAALKARGKFEPGKSDLFQLPPDINKEVIFSVLRQLHAEQAEILSTTQWKVPNSKDLRHFIEDPSLRQAYAESIGSIAHSHHWDIDILDRKLRSTIGTDPSLPRAWVLNEIKVALVLRCADISHIDSRRAPSILYALLKPKGISDEHWSFQNKLIKPTKKKNFLVYSSGEAFGVDDVAGWWRCYDAIQAIDKEIVSCNAVLDEIGLNLFAVSRVEGADSPVGLEKNVRALGWKPVKAELKVSDPAHLAATLGGSNLYGTGFEPPIRELIQNAMDAIKHRLADDLQLDDAKITVTLQEDRADASKMVLHVDDNGIGMSERVMVGPLIDFGRSFWNSQLMRDEYPGLESKGVQSIGKFGIGFFAIFLLGKRVKVTSKRYDAGIIDTRILEFNSLGSRPILKEGKKGDLPNGVNTRVSVWIDKLDDNQAGADAAKVFRHRRSTIDLRMMYDEQNIHTVLRNICDTLLTFSEIKICINDEVGKFQKTHDPDWKKWSSKGFLSKIVLPEDSDDERFIDIHSEHVRFVRDHDVIVGRASIRLLHTDEYHRSPFSSLTVGGFRYGESDRLPYVGVMQGDVNLISRGAAHLDVSLAALQAWASEQADILDKSKFSNYELLRISNSICRFDGNLGALPICYLGGEYVTEEELKSVLQNLDHIIIPTTQLSYGRSIVLEGISSETVELGKKLKKNVLYNFDKDDESFSDHFDGADTEYSSEDLYEILIETMFSSPLGQRCLNLINNSWMSFEVVLRSENLYEDMYYIRPDNRIAIVLLRKGKHVAD